MQTQRVSGHWVGRDPEALGVLTPIQASIDSQAWLDGQLFDLLRQHSRCRDLRHRVLLAWMVAGLLLSQTVCFDRWQSVLPLGHGLAASWQRLQRWFSNARIEVGSLYGPLVLWAIQAWQKPDQALHLALDTTLLGNRFSVAMLSVLCHSHGRAIPLLWQTLEHPSASVCAAVVIDLLLTTDRLLADVSSITLLADRGFPSSGLLGWFEAHPRGGYGTRLEPCLSPRPGCARRRRHSWFTRVELPPQPRQTSEIAVA